MTVLISGAGIAGLTLGLTLHELGVPFRVYEAVRALRPLGVGINLQPNAVRELLNLGLADELETIGVKTKDYGFYSKLGHEIWTEPRGLHAGYKWPQYSVHRGHLQMMLARVLQERAGPDCLVTGAKAKGFDTSGSAATLHLDDGRHVTGTLLIAADGIHSTLRQQMYPDEGAPIWGGAILWRGTTQAKPFLSGASMALIGHDTQRIVAYPISAPDPDTGLATINWIAELKVDPSSGWRKEDWNRPAQLSEFLPKFENWDFDWLNVPALIRGAQQVFEYPMVDRDPVDSWTQGRVTLMGDAAHPTYPVGSNGASQAIVDARVIGAQMLTHGVTPEALLAYENLMRPRTRNIILANRGSGPDAIMQQVEDLCGGAFDDINDVIPHQTLADHADRYKKLAGFDAETLNAQPRWIPAGAKLA
ncbi:flavin-dependent oxidoreductase [Cognatishimia sp. SS12]|uniref:flavin-dependent oxidoreductase n=1 Tax=Cognatishimia sp. SS12 TaxID=2979465 RepID=UPI00232D243F|nr:flavin-dependent oxidoreductase [Cognatishimia sp. SS12]MDC0739296.1 flavin-dependent oxidoreductase [Cognatishimia sp. SS12]